MNRALAALIGLGIGAAGYAALAWPHTLATGAPAPWLRCAPSMAHALGGLDNRIYTNSREAFERNYARGFRFFETDVRRTRDHTVVLAHDWITPERQPVSPLGPTAAEFRAARVYGRYTPLTLDGLLELLKTHHDARVTLDLKEPPDVLLPTLVRAADAVDPALLDRLVPQSRSAAEAATILRYHRWPLILSIHTSPAPNVAIIETVRRLHVAAVVLNRFRLSPDFARELRAAGAVVYISTANVPGEVSVYRSWGAAGIVTDVLPPDSLCPTS